jgi:hypothetical protein
MADARDSKSRVRKGVRVRLPPPAPALTAHAGVWEKPRCNPGATAPAATAAGSLALAALRGIVRQHQLQEAT